MALVAADSPRDHADCSVEALRSFNGKVHVVLQNACLNCHVAPKSSFQLRRGDAIANLSAALKQVDRKNASASPLLQKAILAHGGLSQPPFKDANAPAYKHLDSWVRLVANPPSTNTKVEEIGSGAAADPSSVPAREIRDPFDPEIFNRSAR